MLRYLNMCLWFDVYFFEYIFSCLIFVWTLGDLLESPPFFSFLRAPTLLTYYLIERLLNFFL
jgi:hypothetical protein